MECMISFVLEKKRPTEGFIIMSFLYCYYRGTQASGVMHEEEIDRCERR